MGTATNRPKLTAEMQRCLKAIGRSGEVRRHMSGEWFSGDDKSFNASTISGLVWRGHLAVAERNRQTLMPEVVMLDDPS